MNIQTQVPEDYGHPDVPRCGWVPPDDRLYCYYHDTEWGRPIRDPKALFSKLIQDGQQAGLSWIIQNEWKEFKDAPVKSPESEAMSKDLKKRGFKFVGPVILYAFMQAVGMINDHSTDCHAYADCRDKRVV